MTYISELTFFPTMDCNFSCDHCAYDRSKEEIPFESAQNIINQIPDSRIKNVHITGGGEPFLYTHIKDLIGYLDKTRKKTKYPERIEIVTNGSWIDKNVSERMEELKTLGIDTVIVSSDIYHDKFNKKNIMLLKKKSILMDKERIPDIRFMMTSEFFPLGKAKKNVPRELWSKNENCALRQYYFIQPISMIGVYVFPDGFYACGLKKWRVADLDERIVDVVENIKNKRTLEFLCAAGLKRAVGHIRDSLPEDFSEKIADSHMCALCEEILETPGLKEIIESELEKIEALVTENDESNGLEYKSPSLMLLEELRKEI